jgi:hypothetical protein
MLFQTTMNMPRFLTIATMILFPMMRLPTKVSCWHVPRWSAKPGAYLAAAK